MKIVSTRGYQIEGHSRKAYRITTSEGDSYDCTPSGSAGYELLGTAYRSLKECKKDIEGGLVADNTGEPAIDVETAGKTWDCVDPCAILITIAPPILGCELIRTLDAHGWLTPEGLPDRAAAAKEFERIRSLNSRKEMQQ